MTTDIRLVDFIIGLITSSKLKNPKIKDLRKNQKRYKIDNNPNTSEKK